MNSSNDQDREFLPVDRHEPLKRTGINNITSDDDARLRAVQDDRNDKRDDREASAPVDDSEERPAERVQDQSSRETEEFQASSKELIKRLLNLPSPRLDVKIVSVLSVEGMMDIFMSHITLLEPSDNKTDLCQHSLRDKVDYAKHDRSMDIEAMKRSYHAMELLCGSSPNHHWIQDTYFGTIVSHLMDVFLPNSGGNLNHFAKIFQHLLRRHSCEMLQELLFQDGAAKLIHYMLPYLSYGQVSDSIIGLLFFPDMSTELREKQRQGYIRLYEVGILQWFLHAIQLEDRPKFAEAAKDLLVRIIEECSQNEYGEYLLKAMGQDEFVQDLMHCIAEPKNDKLRVLAIKIIRSLVACGTPAGRASASTLSPRGPMYNICKKFRILLAKNIKSLCSVLTERNQPGNVKFGLLELETLDIIFYVLLDAPDRSQTLDDIPEEFWAILIEAFLEKSNSNIYHCIVFKILHLVFGMNHERTLVIILEKCDLVSRLVEAFENDDQSRDIRGFVLLILNLLRLSSDADKRSVIHQQLSCHKAYEDFLPKLRTLTMAQTESLYSWKLETCPRPAPHLGPVPPLRPSLMFSSYSSTTLPLMGGSAEPVEDTSGIDLGSDYAYCLGFDHTDAPDGVGCYSNYQSRRGSIHSDSEDSSYSSGPDSRPASPANYLSSTGIPLELMFESLTPEEPPSTKKKKKKKKKPATPEFDENED